MQTEFARDGYLICDGLFDPDEIALLSQLADDALQASSEEVTYERRAGVARATHGNHRKHPVFAGLVASPALLRLVEHLLGGPVYVHQFKINAKAALVGDPWEWHQDFAFWHLEDGMPRPDALTVGIFLDQVHEFNGPLMLVPGSHRCGTLATERRADGWRATLETNLKHQIPESVLREVLRSHPIVAPKGEAGTTVIFHSNLLHGSGPNMSAESRRMLLISYNLVENALRRVCLPDPHSGRGRRT